MSALIRIIELILAFKFGKKGGLVQQSQVITQGVINNIRQMVAVILIAVGALALFCVGVSLGVAEFLRLLDQPGNFMVSAVFIGEFLLAFLSLAVMIVCLREKTWLRVTTLKSAENRPTGVSPVEEALALVIKDFVVERQQQRANSGHNSP